MNGVEWGSETKTGVDDHLDGEQWLVLDIGGQGAGVSSVRDRSAACYRHFNNAFRATQTSYVPRITTTFPPLPSPLPDAQVARAQSHSRPIRTLHPDLLLDSVDLLTVRESYCLP